MAVRGPLVTAVVVMGGLIGMMTVNSVGGLVVASENTDTPAATDVAATGSATEETTPPQTTEVPPPAETTEIPPEEETPAEQEQPAAFPAEVVYAGEVDKGPMTIAVAIKGDEAAAYICDGAQVESWLQGTAIDGKLDLKSKDGRNRVVAGLRGADLNGTVTVVGKNLPFTAPVAKAPAGVYRGEGADATIGWIVMADGTQVGIATGPGGSEPAPRLDPAKGAVVLDGKRVEADKVAGDTAF